jgi:hypothetical protein
VTHNKKITIEDVKTQLESVLKVLEIAKNTIQEVPENKEEVY